MKKIHVILLLTIVLVFSACSISEETYNEITTHLSKYEYDAANELILENNYEKAFATEQQEELRNILISHIDAEYKTYNDDIQIPDSSIISYFEDIDSTFNYIVGDYIESLTGEVNDNSASRETARQEIELEIELERQEGLKQEFLDELNTNFGELTLFTQSFWNIAEDELSEFEEYEEFLKEFALEEFENMIISKLETDFDEISRYNKEKYSNTIITYFDKYSFINAKADIEVRLSDFLLSKEYEDLIKSEGIDSVFEDMDLFISSNNITNITAFNNALCFRAYNEIRILFYSNQIQIEDAISFVVDNRWYLEEYLPNNDWDVITENLTVMSEYINTYLEYGYSNFTEEDNTLFAKGLSEISYSNHFIPFFDLGMSVEIGFKRSSWFFMENVKLYVNDSEYIYDSFSYDDVVRTVDYGITERCELNLLDDDYEKVLNAENPYMRFFNDDGSKLDYELTQKEIKAFETIYTYSQMFEDSRLLIDSIMD